MGKLIDIDRLCNDLAKRWSIADKKKESLIRAVMADVVTPIVVSQPTVEAVPVQRCDGCRYAKWHSNGCIAYCTKHGTDGHVADSFCSEGEKDGGND